MWGIGSRTPMGIKLCSPYRTVCPQYLWVLHLQKVDCATTLLYSINQAYNNLGDNFLMVSLAKSKFYESRDCVPYVLFTTLSLVTGHFKPSMGSLLGD